MNKKIPETLYWENGTLALLNQSELPSKFVYKKCKNYADVISAIKNRNVTGTSAVAVGAAYAVVLAGIKASKLPPISKSGFIKKSCEELIEAGRNSINLKRTLERMLNVVENSLKLNPENFIIKLQEAAKEIYNRDLEYNNLMGDFGSRLLKKDSVVLTHCSAGSFASAGYGTALGMIKTGFKNGKIKNVFITETRPYMQGARLTALELQQEKIPYTLITDSMAGYIMKSEKVDAVIVGANKIALNGDVANDIGTYSLSILAKYHKIPFYAVASTDTIDFSATYGVKIKIEEFPPEDVLKINGKIVAPKDTPSRNPGYDVTPASNITMIITEKGVFKPNKISTLKKKS